MRTARWGAAVLSVSIASGACVAAAPSVPPGAAVTPAPTATRPASATPTPPRAAATPPALTGPDAWLAVTQKGAASIHVIRAGTAETMFDLPLGAPTDGRWSHIVTTLSAGDQTIVRTVTVPTGVAPARDIAVDGAWRLPTFANDPIPVGLSTDASTIVLVAETPAPNQTRFAVLKAPFDRAPRLVTVPGTFAYDAVSPDGRTIYVIEHLAAPPAGHYQVRAIDVATSELKPDVIVDKLKIGEPMAGWPVDQLRRTGGSVLTLYRGAEHPFIHALYSADGYAQCIDLPSATGDGTDAALDWGIAPAASGSTVFAANATLGLVVEVNATDAKVLRSAHLKPLLTAGATLAKFGHEDGGAIGHRIVVSPDGSTLYAAGKGGIVAVGTARLNETGRFIAGHAVDALGLTPDGTILYALTAGTGRIAKLDASDGRLLGYVPGDGYTSLLAVVRW